MGTATLTTNSKKLDDIDAVIKSAQEKRRKLVEQSKIIAYSTIANLYGLEGQELIDAITEEHNLIGKLTASGMSFEQILELANNGSADSDTLGQQAIFTEKTNPYED